MSEMPLEIETIVENDAWKAECDPEALARRCIGAIEASLPDRGQNAEVCVVFMDDAAIRPLNRQWRQIDKATNVLSFPSPPAPAGVAINVLGDICLAVETVRREASEQAKTFGDHTSHLVVHGFLHLIGYDHEDAADALAMEREEVRILELLGIANPYDDQTAAR